MAAKRRSTRALAIVHSPEQESSLRLQVSIGKKEKARCPCRKSKRLTGASQPPLNPQRALHLRRCRFNVVLVSRRCGLQQQLGCEIPMQSRLAPRLHKADEA